MHLLTIVGARPQFIKAAMVSRAVIAHNAAAPACERIAEDIIHTGQHYDRNMSQIFFDDMGIPAPAANLDIGSGPHGEMTGKMLAAIESEILARSPDWVLVYGDTNSTLAGALAAAKLHVPVAHVEAGLRSFNRRMPEEINRVLTDHVSGLLLCPTAKAIENLATEGIHDGVHHVGDVMYDAALVFAEIAQRQSTILADLALTPDSFYLATVHRAENTDDPERLAAILAAFAETATPDCPIVFPVHPRTRKLLSSSSRFTSRVSRSSSLRLIEPVSFLDMVMLEKHAKTILTDSGGVQKEAYFHGTPCVTLRDETEWVETVDAGWNQVVGADTARICTAVSNASPGNTITDYGTGHAADAILARLISAE